VLTRMLACSLTWHMQQRLAPVLFKDHDPATRRAARTSPVAPAQRPPAAPAKAATKTASTGQPVHSLATLLADLAAALCVSGPVSRLGQAPGRLLSSLVVAVAADLQAELTAGPAA